MNKDNKLWSKGFEASEAVEKFTVGNDRELDMQLARYDVEGSLAHIQMLQSIGLLSGEELAILSKGLKEIASEIESGNFRIEEDVEDIHSQVEILLTRRFGDIGKKIHSGRSRNDQVLVDIKLFYRHQLQILTRDILSLFDTLQRLSEKHKEKLMPGYTHLQIAMPSSFGLWFGAYAECLTDDMQMILAAYKIANQNPLGSAAGYGSSFPLDREKTTELLKFDTLHYNVVAAQMSRGKTERAVAAAIASVAFTISRIAMDICMWMCQNFAFVSLPDNLTTGSSIMPHKKNPDVFEIMRGKCNRLQSLPNEIALLSTNLPLGYNRDLQLLKDILFPAFGELKDCIAMCNFMLPQLIIKDKILDDSRYDYIFTVEDVNRMVLEGTPFRDAYRNIGLKVQNSEYKPNREIHHTHLGSMGNLATQQIKTKMKKTADQILD